MVIDLGFAVMCTPKSSSNLVGNRLFIMRS